MTDRQRQAAIRHRLRRAARVLSHLQAAAWWWDQAAAFDAAVGMREKELSGFGRSKMRKHKCECARRAHRHTVCAWKEAAQ